MDTRPAQVPPKNVTVSPWNERETASVTVQLLEGNEVRVISGYRRLMARLEVSELAVCEHCHQPICE